MAVAGVPIRVQLLANWCSSTELCELFNPMTSAGNYEWEFRGLDGELRRLRITDSDDDPDFWAVINAPPAEAAGCFDRERTVVFQMEPLMWTERMRGRWGRWAAPSPTSYLQVRDHRRYRNSNDWWLGQAYAELTGEPAAPKTRCFAACVSEKYFDPGHRKRIDFLRFLDRSDLDLDIYGAAGNGFRRYRSATPAHDKRPCLLPYRYYFDAENNAYPNFFTEKIVDCLLAETLCFYWGCPNLDSYFDPRAFIRLELDDFEADLGTISAAIAADEWSARLPYIRAEKQRILDDYGFFPTLARALDPARRSRPWSIGPGRSAIDESIGGRRTGVFVEISDRSEAPELSETLDVERRLDWSGICLEADAARVRTGRSIRDCIVALDRSEPLHAALGRNAIAPAAIDWLNLAVGAPSALLAPGGRIDPARVRANLITLPLADSRERRRCLGILEPFGYEPSPAGDDGFAIVRRGRDEIYGFLHLCAINNWREIAAEQVDHLVSSGLAAATTRIGATVVGPDAAEARSVLADGLGDHVALRFEDALTASYERPTLERARRFCEAEEPLARGVWYVHGKGVSGHHQGNANIADWRLLMEHFVIGGWRECVESLCEYDACGVNWHDRPAPHFSGNFWWARPRYLATLPEAIGAAPFDQEAWIGINQPRVRSLHESGVDHHLEPYPERLYRR